MAILYRAIWSESDTDLVARVHHTFLDWVRNKSEGEIGRAASDLTTEMKTPDGTMRLLLEHESSDQESAPIRAALRASFIETRDNGSRWTTTVRSWTGPLADHEPSGHGGWVWVDIEAVAHDLLEHVIVAAPKFVRQLLESASGPNRFDVPLSSTPRNFRGEEGAEELAHIITDIYRDVPIVVFAPLLQNFNAPDLPPGISADEWFNEITERAAAMSAGLTLVSRLDIEAAQSFRTIVGEAYEVRDGAFRIYLPGVDPATDEAWRHRYTVPARFMRYRDMAGRLINRAISLRAGARRAPDSYDAVEQLLGSATSKEPAELQELLHLADEELAEQRTRLAMLDQQYLNVIEEQQQLEEENNRLRSEVDRARKMLAMAGTSIWDDQSAASWSSERADLPDSADSPSQAASLAKIYLANHLSFPDGACVDLDDIDNAVEARAWGETSWRAFLALHEYGAALAREEDPGSFWTWCENSGHPYAWPATRKKLAMKESESVNNNPKLRAKRVFPVDKAVNASGKLFMQAHVKVAEGGGPLAPRIYFHVSHETKMVYIGYFGPHRNVPNTLT